MQLSVKIDAGPAIFMRLAVAASEKTKFESHKSTPTRAQVAELVPLDANVACS